MVNQNTDYEEMLKVIQRAERDFMWSLVWALKITKIDTEFPKSKIKYYRPCNFLCLAKGHMKLH